MIEVEEEAEQAQKAERESVRIAAISDTHGVDFSHPEADIFIHAGDMTGWGTWSETVTVGRSLGEQYDTVFLVPGNHDNPFVAFRDGDLNAFFPNTHLLIDKAWEHRGLLFYGSPWVPFFNGVNPSCMAFMRTEDELRRRFLNMPAEIDVLITHGPPKGILDDGKGSEALREAIETRKIRAHLFGHIHECGGMHQTGDNGDGTEIDFYNVSGIRFNAYNRAPLILNL